MALATLAGSAIRSDQPKTSDHDRQKIDDTGVATAMIFTHDQRDPVVFALLVAGLCLESVLVCRALSASGQIVYLATASSSHSMPQPSAPSIIADPLSIRIGFFRIGFHQSLYSSQCAVGVQHSNCALISGHR